VGAVAGAVAAGRVVRRLQTGDASPLISAKCGLSTTTRQLRGSCSSVVSGLRCELVERDVCRELLMNGVRQTVGLPERGDRERWTTNVADHGHDLDRLAVGVLLVPFAEEQSPARGSRQAAQ